jgi:hypothetical protein
MAATPGQRVYLIRLAHGDGVKNPMPLAEFVALVKKRRGARYDASAISRMENGTRKVTLEDIDVLAPMDPLRRGKAWLACWEDDRPPVQKGPDEPSAQERAEFVNHELEAARKERERAEATKAAGGTKGSTRRR